MVTLKFGVNGLIPAVAQDAASGEILMLAYMDREALQRTVESGDAWYWSRSRGRLWRKGEESGHTQRVRQIRVDCDSDALVLVVEQTGNACHTGHRSCFYRDLDGAERATVRGEPVEPQTQERRDIIDEVFAVIRQRAAELPEGSYTATLIRGGPEAIAAKVREESAEFIAAARDESGQRLAEEAADLLYHSMVVLASRGVGLDDVRRELRRRRHAR